jgi:hypothetical protein
MKTVLCWTTEPLCNGGLEADISHLSTQVGLQPKNITSDSTTGGTRGSGTYSIFSDLCFPRTFGNLHFAFPQRVEGSDWHVVEGSGYAIALHYQAEGAWKWMLGWLKRNGF